MAHTPGPWEVAPKFGFRGGDIRTSETLTFLFQSLNASTEADARLIAEAPAMLEALQQVHRRGYMFDHDAPLWGDIDALLERINGSTRP